MARTTLSALEENSLKIREIAQQNVYILFPNARESLLSSAFSTSKAVAIKQGYSLPKIQSNQPISRDPISLMSTGSSAVGFGQPRNISLAIDGGRNDTVVKPIMATKRSEVNQVQGMFKIDKQIKREPYKGLDVSLEFQFPYRQMVDFVQKHSGGFEEKQNIDLHKHYQRMYIKNKYCIKKLRNEKNEREIRLHQREQQEQHNLEKKRLEIKQMLTSKNGSLNTPNVGGDSTQDKITLKAKQFIINQNLNDLSEFNHLLNQYEDMFLQKAQGDTLTPYSSGMRVTKEDLIRQREYENQFLEQQAPIEFVEGGLLWELMQRQASHKKLHIMNSLNNLMKDKNYYINEEKSVKIVEDIFLEQILQWIQKNGMKSLNVTDYYNFKGIILNRKNKYKQMRKELMEIVDIKRHIRKLIDDDKRIKFEDLEKECAKVYLSDDNPQLSLSYRRRSQMDTNDQTNFDSILYNKNSTSINTSERYALQPRLIDFVPPQSFLPKLLGVLNEGYQGKKNNKSSVLQSSLAQNISVSGQNNISSNQDISSSNIQKDQLLLPKQEDNPKQLPINIEKLQIGLENQDAPLNLIDTERSKESQLAEDADMNQLQYLMKLENNDASEKEQEEAMKTKMQIIKLMMKDDKKAIMKKLQERIMSKIEKRKEELLMQIQQEENKERLLELQEELQRELKKKNVQLMLLTHASSLKRISHRLMYECDQQSQNYRELNDDYSKNNSEYQGQPDPSIEPETIEAIFDMIDNEEDVVANYIINQLDKQGVLEKLLQYIQEQEQSGTIDMEKIKEYILLVNNGIPPEEALGGETKTKKFIFKGKNQQQQEIEDQLSSRSRKSSANYMDYKNVDNNKKRKQNGEKGGIGKKGGQFQMEKDSDEDDNDNNRGVNNSQGQNSPKSKITKNKIRVNNESTSSQRLNQLKGMQSNRSGSMKSDSNGSISKKSSLARINFNQKDFVDESINQTHRREVMLQLKGYDQANEILFEQISASQALDATEQLKIKRQGEQKKMKTIGQKMKFSNIEDDPEMERIQRLIEQGKTSKKNDLLATKNQKKQPQKNQRRAASSELFETSDDLNPGKILRSNSSEQNQEVKRRKDSKGNHVYFDKQGNKIDKIKAEEIMNQGKKSVYEQMEVEVTDSEDESNKLPIQYDSNGNPIPRIKKKKKKLITFKKNENGEMVIVGGSSSSLSSIPQNIKINKDGQVVKIVKKVLEDGTIVEVEEEVQATQLGKVVKGKEGEFVPNQSITNSKKKKKKILQKLPNGKEVLIEVTDSENEANKKNSILTIETDKISVSLSDEDLAHPLTPTTKAAKIAAKQQEKKQQMVQEKAAEQNAQTKKKIIKKIVKENGEIEEVITEVDDTQGGEEVQVFDSKGNLISKSFKATEKKQPAASNSKQKGQAGQAGKSSDKNEKSAGAIPLNKIGTGQKQVASTASGQTTKKNQPKKQGGPNKEGGGGAEEWFNDDGTPWTGKQKKDSSSTTAVAAAGGTTLRSKDPTSQKESQRTNQDQKGAGAIKEEKPGKIKKIINGQEVEYKVLGSQESFDSDDIPAALLDDSRSIKSADINAMPEDQKKLFQKIKQKKEEVKQLKIKEQLEKDIKDFRKNNVFTELEELMKSNPSLKDLKRQIEVYLELIKGKQMDDETKYNIFLYLQRKEQIAQFLIAFEDNFESNVLMKPDVMQELRQFLKKRLSMVKASNEKKMKFSRPIIMQDGNGLSLFEEFKGEGISEWEIHMIMKYASYNQDVDMITKRLRLFKEDQNALQQLKNLLAKFESLVIQTDLDYLRDLNQANMEIISEEREFDLQQANQLKTKTTQKTQSQIDQENYEKKIRALRTVKKKNPEKFQGLVSQFLTVREDKNVFKILKNDLAEKSECMDEHMLRTSQQMWTNRIKQFNQSTKINFKSLNNSSLNLQLYGTTRH